jgi:gamma-glutamyl hercynylcysteine S-oxide synthase
VHVRRPAVAEGLEEGRRRTLELFAPLSPDDLARQPHPILSPPLWDLGHIAAYEELWVLRNLAGREALYPDLDTVYDAFETPRARRGDAAILPEAETRRFLERVRSGTLEVLRTADVDEQAPPLTRDGFVFEMVAEHEAQHCETVLQAMQMLPAGGYVPPERRPLPRSPRDAGDAWIAVPGGEFTMGAEGHGFAYDCERPPHRVAVDEFLIARDPVTCGDHLAFMEDGGYRRRGLWTDAGWAWLRQAGAEAPAYWERDGEGGWLVRSYERLGPVDPRQILCHVSAHEADAHARWAGARLPTEDEWERAADGARAEPDYANLDQRTFGPAVAGALPAPRKGAPRHMLGDVWEWTSTVFEAYPGFRAFPYREYSEVFFGQGYRVLRGGSWATSTRAIRTSFRNWDLPQRRQIFAGLRLARDAA